MPEYREISRISVLCVMLFMMIGCVMAQPQEAKTGAVVNVKNFSSKESFTSGIQEAINALPKSGGTVIIPAGTYEIRRSIIPKSNIVIKGEGYATVLLRPKEFRTTVLNEIPPNKTQARVKGIGVLKVGDQILIKDNNSGGWHSRHGLITSIKENVLEMDVINSHKHLRYSPNDKAFLTNWFPGIWLWSVSNVTMKDLVIDGGIAKHHSYRSDFVVSAIHSRGCKDLKVENCIINNWPGDGISLQKTDGAMVRGNTVDNCRGNGLHPGSGSSNTIWTENISRNNTRRGFFFCMRVTHCVCKDNLFLNNGEEGIGGLGSGDQFNVVSGNICVGNAEYGIEAENSICNIIQGNICRNNCKKKRTAGIYLKNHRDTIVRDNLCVDNQEKPTQTKGVVSEAPAGKNIIENNHTVVEKKK
ncbi:nitrous oxide reductase family maturation protein NosD [Planctomycetota bacterium]